MDAWKDERVSGAAEGLCERQAGGPRRAGAASNVAEGGGDGRRRPQRVQQELLRAIGLRVHRWSASHQGGYGVRGHQGGGLPERH